MRYHELRVTSFNKRKRVGRGIGSGHGKTAGRGTKGQGSRSGKPLRKGFEGGQTPLAARIPRLRGFKSKTQPTQVIYTRQLNQFKKQTKITPEKLKEAGLITDTRLAIKLILNGEVKCAYSITVTRVSKNAALAVRNAGGEVKLIGREGS